MKKLFMLMLAFMFAMLIVSCGDKDDPETDNAVVDNDTVVKDDAPAADDYVEPDEDTVVEKCKLDTAFYDAMPTDWTSWFTITMTGEINAEDTPQADLATALSANVKVKLGGAEKNIGDNFSLFIATSVNTTAGETIPVVLAQGLGGVKQLSTKIGTVYDYYVGLTFTAVSDLQTWKTQLDTEGTPHALITVDGAMQAQIIHQLQDATAVRKVCWAGLAALNADSSAFDGAMAFCLDGNTEFAVGEIMKQMYYVKIIEDETELLAALNEGLETTDPNYTTSLCTCYSLEVDGNGDNIEMPCDELDAQMNGTTTDDDDVVTPDEDVIVTDELLNDN